MFSVPKPDLLGTPVGILDLAVGNGGPSRGVSVAAGKSKAYGFAGDFGPCTDACSGEAVCP